MALSDRELVERDQPSNKGSITVDPDGATVNNVVINGELNGDWTRVFELFNLDAAEFEVVDDTVKMSTWQQSARAKDGSRDSIQLYSYSARFRRITAAHLSEVDHAAILEKIAKWKPLKRTLGAGLGPESHLHVDWADWQLYKSEGGGIEAAVDRVHASFEATIARVKELRRIGRNITGIAVANMGDPIEGCDGNYASQLFSVQGGLRKQLLTCTNLWIEGIRTLAPLAEHMTFISALCNHGEWMRRGGKSVTTDSDNASGYLGDNLQTYFEDRPDFAHINWHIPHDEMVTAVNIAGIEVAHTHGHKISGKEEDWLRGQSIRLLRERGRDPQLWVTAHRHHAYVMDTGPWWRIQCSTLDGGSKWFTDMTGKWSTPGTTTFLVGTHDPRGFSDWQVI